MNKSRKKSSLVQEDSISNDSAPDKNDQMKENSYWTRLISIRGPNPEAFGLHNVAEDIKTLKIEQIIY